MLKAARLSAVRFVQDTLLLFDPAIGIGVSYVDWDDHADMKGLANTDLIGLAGFGITEHTSGTYEVSFAVTIATYNDGYLLRAIDYADTFYSRMVVGQEFEIFNPADGLHLGWAKFTPGTTCNPVNRAEVRSAQTIVASAVIIAVES